MTPSDGTVRTALDLGAASSRADEVGVDAPIPPSEVAELFGALDKAIRAQRLYQPNNPVYQSFISGAQNAFARLWDGVPALTASVEEHAFRWYSKAFHAGEGRDSLPFLFYKDGIRFVTFMKGFESEVERFLNVVNKARSHDLLGDDMVTLLWQEEFAYFQYSYVDALAEGLQVPQSSVPKLAGMELTLAAELAPAPEGERADRPVPAAVEEGKPPVAGL